MNIIEAIKSGKKFKRPKDDWLHIDKHTENVFFTDTCGDTHYWVANEEDLIADDWEIEEEKRELSWAQIEKACLNAHHAAFSMSERYIFIKKVLGFKDE